MKICRAAMYAACILVVSAVIGCMSTVDSEPDRDVAEAELSVEAKKAACAHDICEEGEALDPKCDQCVKKICREDSFCCEIQWDLLCVEEVTTICGQTCP